MFSKVYKSATLFTIGGLVYVMMELITRGRSHWSMFIVGGICFLLIGYLNEGKDSSCPIVAQMAYGAVIITAIEFISGCILNLMLGWQVWDYSRMPLNLLGQICLPFSVLWFFISGIAIVLDDGLRHVMFGEPIPRYRIV